MYDTTDLKKTYVTSSSEQWAWWSIGYNLAIGLLAIAAAISELAKAHARRV